MKSLAGPLVLISLLALPAAGQEAGRGIFPYDTRELTLDNGLRVVLVPMSSGGLVAYWSIVRTGARDEYEPGRTGFAHFFEHMMFRGTEKMPAEAFNAFVTEIGAEVNAFTSDDLTAYYLNITADDLEKVMEVESDRFANLAYPEEMFETEAGAAYGEYRKNRSRPMFAAYEAIYKTAFRDHTYGHSTMGHEEDIAAMPSLFDYSKTFFKRYYRPENTVLLIVGDIEVDPTVKLVERYYGGWQRGYVPPVVPPEPAQTKERRVDVAFPGKSLPIVWIGYKSQAFDPADITQTAARLLCDLLFGETSEIYKLLVLDEQVVETISASFNTNRDPGLIDVISRVKDPSKIDYVISEIDRVIAGAQREPPDPQRLADLQSRLKYSFLMNLDTPAKTARRLVRTLAVTGGLDAVEQLYDSYDRVTPEDVVAAAKAYFVNQRRTVAVLKGES